MDELTVKVVSPKGILLEDKASSVQLYASDGWFGVIKNTAPTVADIVRSEMIYVKNGEKKFFPLSSGFAYIRDNTVTLLVGSSDSNLFQ